MAVSRVMQLDSLFLVVSLFGGLTFEPLILFFESPSLLGFFFFFYFQCSTKRALYAVPRLEKNARCVGVCSHDNSREEIPFLFLRLSMTFLYFRCFLFWGLTFGQSFLSFTFFWFFVLSLDEQEKVHPGLLKIRSLRIADQGLGL